MKQYLLIALLAALLLSGCGNTTAQTEPSTEAAPGTSVETTMPTEPLPSFYLENSSMERGTGGAVKLFELEGTVTGMAMLGENLLICEDGSRLYLLDPVTMKILRSRELDTGLDWDDESLVITESGMAYYHDATSTYVILDTNLLSVSSYVIDAEMDTRPVITHSFEKICYGIEGGLEVMTLSDGTARRIREEHQKILSVDNLLLGDTLLCYTRETADGEKQSCFISTDDGRLLDTAQFNGTLYALGDRFVCLSDLEHALGRTKWLSTGTVGAESQRLQSQYQWEEALLLSDGRVILQAASRVGMTLYCYDLTTGLLLAQIIMPGQTEYLTMGGGNGQTIWLSDGTGNRVFCWDTTIDPRPGESSELIPYASLAKPDPAAMAQVERLAQILGDRFDVTITFAEEQNRTVGVDYSDYADTRPEQYTKALEMLRLALEKLPEGLMYQIGRGADSDRVEILLLDGYDPERNTTQSTGAIDVTGGELVIRVNMCPELESIFYHELFHLMEVRIRTLTDGFEGWEELNPPVFQYTHSFEDAQSGVHHASAYLQKGSNYFADEYGMISQREDRAQVFLYAMKSGEQNRFLSDTMQEKLLRVSDTLRACFKISEDVTPLWEQYLEKEA